MYFMKATIRAGKVQVCIAGERDRVQEATRDVQARFPCIALPLALVIVTWAHPLAGLCRPLTTVWVHFIAIILAIWKAQGKRA